MTHHCLNAMQLLSSIIYEATFPFYAYLALHVFGTQSTAMSISSPVSSKWQVQHCSNVLSSHSGVHKSASSFTQFAEFAPSKMQRLRFGQQCNGFSHWFEVTHFSQFLTVLSWMHWERVSCLCFDGDVSFSFFQNFLSSAPIPTKLDASS